MKKAQKTHMLHNFLLTNLHARLKGLKLILSRDFRKVKIESDNVLLIDTLRNEIATVNNIIEI